MRLRKSMFEVAALLDETIEKGERVERLANMSLADLVMEHRRLCKSMSSATSEIAIEAKLAARSRLEHLIKSRTSGDLRKAISFNPIEPHEMNAESSFYNPYRQLGDGSYAPHPTEHWMSQEPSLFLDGEFGGRRVGVGSAHSEAQRRDGYSEVDRFYRAAGVFKSELYASVDELVKAIPKAPKSGKPRGFPVGTVHTYGGIKYQKQADGQWTPVSDPKGVHPVEQDAQAKAAKLQKLLEDRKAGKANEPSFEDRARVATAKHQEISTKEADLEKRDREAKDREHDHREKDLTEREAKLKEQQKALEEHSKKLGDHGKKAPLDQQFVGDEAQAALEKKVAKRPPGKGEHVELTKAELAHTLRTGKFALVSAGKNFNHPEDSKLKDADIKKRGDRLEKELKESGYAYTRVKGHYGGEEDSFLVMIHQADRNHMVAIGKKLNQDSIIYADGGKQEMVYTTGDKAGQSHTGEGFQEKPDAEDFYSEMETADGGKVKFSLNFDFDNLKGKQVQKAPGDGKRPENHMGPPPPENEDFVKPGKSLDHKAVDKFIREFEPDFKALTSMADDLKKAGASHFSSRLKDVNSLHTKMTGRLADRSLNTVTDVIGARALANSFKDQQSILKHLKSNNELVEVEDSTKKPRSDGYRAIHVLFRTPSGKIGELQIKTHRQQIFSGFTHDAIYKGKPEIKNDPEVNKFAMSLSNYLYGLDKGKPDDPSKRPQEPEALKKEGIAFPWDKLAEVDSMSKAKGPIKHYVVVRDKDKKTVAVHEHDKFSEARKHRDELRKAGENKDGEHVLAYAHSKEEMLRVFSEYAHGGPGSRGGTVVGKTKSGNVKYQKKGGKT